METLIGLLLVAVVLVLKVQLLLVVHLPLVPEVQVIHLHLKLLSLVVVGETLQMLPLNRVGRKLVQMMV